MFERLVSRIEGRAERRAEETALVLSERMRAALPRGIEVKPVRRGVRLSGRGLMRRFALDAALRWLLR